MAGGESFGTTTRTRMQRLNLLVCLGAMCAASSLAALVDPRGARPVEPGTRSEKCASEKEWPFCTDDQWGSKCPSGCRIQGLMDQFDHDAVRKIEKIRSLLAQNKAQHRSTDLVTKETYNYLTEKLTLDGGNDNSYYNLAQSLRQRITDMKIKIDRQLGVLGALKKRVKDQVLEMQRLEVDIDIKLRSCKGSCQSYTQYDVDHESYVALEKQVNQLDSQSDRSIQSVGTLYVMKSRPLKQTVVNTLHKSKDLDGGQQKENMFPNVPCVEYILEQEGSISSPATISKVPGTSYSQSTPSPGSSFHSYNPSKSITELGGGDFGGGLDGDGFGLSSTGGHISTKTTNCHRTIRKTIVHSKDGPVEKTEEVIEGGPECQGMMDRSKGEMGSFFPSLTSSSSSSSSSSLLTKTVQTGGTKGPVHSDPFGDDLGFLRTADVEDDLPDFHARSTKSMRTERHADYVGKDCVAAHQNHLKGEANGLFKIKPGGADSTQVVEVYCQQEGLMGGWLLVQQRESGVLSFNRTWAEYRGGFGAVDAGGKGEFWLGNQNLHLLTNQGESMLKVEMEDWEGGVAAAEYTIVVGPEAEGYPLHVSAYTGDAGDALGMPTADTASHTASHLSHAGMRFSTFDRDNDRWEDSCAEVYGGGWWYNSCQSANLNGVYYRGSYDPEKNTPHEVANGIVWATYKPANYSLKTVRMFIRPVAL